jgi:hypothetical protein
LEAQAQPATFFSALHNSSAAPQWSVNRRSGDEGGKDLDTPFSGNMGVDRKRLPKDLRTLNVCRCGLEELLWLSIAGTAYLGLFLYRSSKMGRNQGQ